MQSVPSTETRRRTYVVTYGMAHRLQSFRSGAFKVPQIEDLLFKDFERSLAVRVQQALPGVTIHAIHMHELERKIWEHAARYVRQNDPVFLSTCSELASASQTGITVEGYTLHFNRLFNTDGEIIGYGPRHGFDSLSAQFKDLALKIGTRSIILLEDGAFSGKTLCFILEKLKAQGLKVSKVIIGFCCTRAQAVLTRSFDGDLIIVDQIEDLIDWVPDHDLMPFTPNCGRVLGKETDEGFCAIQTEDGHTCAYPYILPFGKMGDWSSLPVDCMHGLSCFCLDSGIAIFSEIGEYVGHKVTVRDLRRSYPMFSLPITVGNHHQIPSSDTEIVGFLKQVRKELE